MQSIVGAKSKTKSNSCDALGDFVGIHKNVYHSDDSGRLFLHHTTDRIDSRQFYFLFVVFILSDSSK